MAHRLLYHSDLGLRVIKEKRRLEVGQPKRKFLDGNYDTYYNYRNPGAADDPRLEVLLLDSRYRS